MVVWTQGLCAEMWSRSVLLAWRKVEAEIFAKIRRGGGVEEVYDETAFFEKAAFSAYRSEG